MTHRAVLLAMLAEGSSRIEAPNAGADAESTLAAAVQLGATVTARADGIEIRGLAGRLSEPGQVLDCGNSGTSLRLLAGVLAAQPILAVLTGDDSLRRRPVARIVAPLRRMGAWLSARDRDRFPPLVVRGTALGGTRFDETTPSAQVASCLLLAGLGARGVTSVRTLPGVRDHTAHAFASFGVPLLQQRAADGATRWSIEGPRVPRACRLRIPGDLSAAAFFLAGAAATPGASVTAEGVGLNPTRTGLLDVLEEMGAGVERRETGRAGEEPVGSVTVTGPQALRAVSIAPERVPSLIDEIPAWTIAAAAAIGTSVLAGAGELRVKESDRLSTLARNLGALGVEVEERRDGLAVTGGRIRGGTVEAEHDHRIAMAFAVLAARAEGDVRIAGAGGIVTSFPEFLATLGGLGGRVDAGGAAA